VAVLRFDEADGRLATAALESALQALDSPVVILDSSGRIVWLNAASERLSGYRLEQIGGAAIWDVLIPRDELEGVESVFRHLAEGAGSSRFENDWLTSKGGRVRISWSNTVVADDSGRIRYVIGTGTDVRELRRAEKALQTSELKARALLDAALGGILAVDPGGIIQVANPELERMFGYGRGELAGRPLSALIPERVRAAHELHHKRYYHHPASRLIGAGLDLRGLRKDGTEFPVEISLGYAGPEADDYVVAFVLDVSESRRSQEALAKSRDEIRDLAARVLTAQEDERRLIARELHDGLVQELVALKLDLAVLARNPATAQAGLLDDVKRAESEAQGLAESARAISHELHPAALEQLGLAPALRANAKEVLRSTGIEVRVEAEGPAPALTRQAALGLYRIAQEAIWNAARHSGSARATVAVRTDADELILEVSDKGKGFDFAGVRGARSLGLVSMEERARLIGAKLEIDSHPGQGTIVRVTLKLERPA
jgi:PAS domain S-box-containing protein